MIGIIPAAGSAIRARPYTYELHKGMFLIDGKPNIQRHIELMRDEMGIEEIVIVLGYMAETITAFFGDGSDHGVRLTYVCLLYTSPSPRDQRGSRMPSSA